MPATADLHLGLAATWPRRRPAGLPLPAGPGAHLQSAVKMVTGIPRASPQARTELQALAASVIPVGVRAGDPRRAARPARRARPSAGLTR